MIPRTDWHRGSGVATVDGVRIQFAGHTAQADSVTIEDGVLADRGILAVCRRAGHLVAVLGQDRTRLFTRRRRQLSTTVARVGSA
ncbi:hypothetical protein ACFYWX_34185 [Streptomyces sp. NPDC002888]|uniref:hypothetical protein n=1 Tax=Streptomyces sp. NPDC002888 TaxID=3364668 RepID=UPI0036BEE1DE